MDTALTRHPAAQMLVAVTTGLVVGVLAPQAAPDVAPLGDLFGRAVALVLHPLMFCMLTASVASLRGGGRLGRTGAYTLLYFALLSVLSLGADLLAAALLQPGAGIDGVAGWPTPAAAAPVAASVGATSAHWLAGAVALLRQAGNLPLLLLAVLAGLMLGRPGAHTAALLARLAQGGQALQTLLRCLLRLAPVAAFGAVANASAHGGLAALLPLLKFVGASYLVCALFVLLVMGAATALCGVPITRLLHYLRAELWLVFCTASSLAALPRLTEKMRHLGCPAPLVALVLPFGYTLNLAGTNLYVGMALVFLAQAGHVTLGWPQLLVMLLVGLVTTKGAVGVAGSGFATLAATLVLLPTIPPHMLALLIGVERLMKCRSLTNVVGNAVACIAVAGWQRQLDRGAMATALKCP